MWSWDWLCELFTLKHTESARGRERKKSHHLHQNENDTSYIVQTIFNCFSLSLSHTKCALNWISTQITLKVCLVKTWTSHTIMVYWIISHPYGGVRCTYDDWSMHGLCWYQLHFFIEIENLHFTFIPNINICWRIDGCQWSSNEFHEFHNIEMSFWTEGFYLKYVKGKC